MTVAFLINQTHKEEKNCTTSLLAFTAWQRGHAIWYIGIADFGIAKDGSVWAHARIPDSDQSFGNAEELVTHLRHQEKKVFKFQKKVR